MKNVERSLQNAIRIKGYRIPPDQICAYAQKEGNDFINILFKILGEQLDQYTGKEKLDYLIPIFEYINIAMTNNHEISRKNIIRKVAKLEEHLDRISTENKSITENKSMLLDTKRTYKELAKIRDQALDLENNSMTKETKQYDFISCLVDEVKFVTYIEYAFNKLPALVNAKDKDGVTLYRNVIRKYLNCVEEGNEEDILYYGGLATLIREQDNFTLTTTERRECLAEIYRYIDKTSNGKKKVSNRKEKLYWADNIKEIVMQKEDSNQNINELAAKYNISVAFDDILLESVNLPQTQFSKKNYPDRKFIKDYIITIDDTGAKEIDDALSCRKLRNGNYLLGVHIASVLGYLPYESPVIDEAIDRGHAIYLPKRYQNKDNDFNKLIPILPYSFSAQKMTLIENEPRLTRSYYFEIDNEGNVIDEKFFKTVITNKKKTTFGEVNNVLEHGSENQKFQETIMNLRDVCDCLAKAYKPQELYERIKENNPDSSDLRVNRKGAGKIVYYPMLLVGNHVAEFFADPSRDYPCLYRVHSIDKTMNNRIEEMVKTLTTTYGGDKYEKLYHLLKGIYPSGSYAMSGRHDGLELDHYCHCTSELRRAPDILVEHGLEVCYDKNPTDKELMKLEEEIKRRTTQINAKIKPIDWFVDDYAKTFVKKRK